MIRIMSIVLMVIFSISACLVAPEVKANADTQEAVTKAVEHIKKVNINSATAEELAAKLNGIGLKRAKAIIEHRELVGGFKNIEQLIEIKGIGKATLDKNRNIIIM